MTFQNKENTPSTIENGKKLEQNKLDFQNPDILFSQLKNKDNISKEVFEKIFSDFENKTGKQGREILENISDFTRSTSPEVECIHKPKQSIIFKGN